MAIVLFACNAVNAWAVLGVIDSRGNIWGFLLLLVLIANAATVGFAVAALLTLADYDPNANQSK